MQAIAFPTPTAKDADGSRDTSMKPGSRRNKGRTLTDATMDLWQTPATDSFRSRGGDRKDEQGLDQQARVWPTPRTITGGGESAERKKELERMDAGGGDLQAAVENWRTPNTRDHHAQGPRLAHPQRQTALVDQANIWPSPRAEDSEGCGNHPGAKDSLTGVTKAWPSPNSRDHEGSDLSSRNGGASLSHFAETGERTHGNPQSSPQVQVISVHGGELSPTDPSTASRRRLNPAFVCWLMGWPWWWTNPGEISFARRATELYLSRLRTLLRSLLGERDSPR